MPVPASHSRQSGAHCLQCQVNVRPLRESSMHRWRALPDDVRGLVCCAGAGLFGGFAAVAAGALVLGLMVCGLGSYAAVQYDDGYRGRGREPH